MEKILKMRITFINVGNGDAILVECPSEKGRFTMLIDGGSGEPEEYEDNHTGRIRAADFLERVGVDHLDLLVNTHIHEDHTCGLLPVVEKWVPRQFWQPYALSFANRRVFFDEKIVKKESTGKFLAALQAYQKLCDVIIRRGGSICQIVGNDVPIPLCSGLKARVLGPGIREIRERMEHFERLYSTAKMREKLEAGEGISEEKEQELTAEELRQLEWLDEHMNNSSIQMILKCSGRKILLVGDAEASDCDYEEREIKADIFKVGHHGQKNGLNKKLLYAVSPRYTVICASSDRRYNSAAAELLEMTAAFGSKLVFSDCPEAAPYTDGVYPHLGVQFDIFADGEMNVQYIPVNQCQ